MKLARREARSYDDVIDHNVGAVAAGFNDTHLALQPALCVEIADVARADDHGNGVKVCWGTVVNRVLIVLVIVLVPARGAQHDDGRRPAVGKTRLLLHFTTVTAPVNLFLKVLSKASPWEPASTRSRQPGAVARAWLRRGLPHIPLSVLSKLLVRRPAATEIEPTWFPSLTAKVSEINMLTIMQL